MKDEIKEIIEGLNYISNSGENASIEFNSKDCKLLSNYIINLQDRIDKTIMTINEFRQINYETIKRLSNKTGISDMLKNDNTIYNLIESILTGEQTHE